MMWSCLQADGETAPVQVKTEVVDDTDTTENSAAWSILHDDFMMGATMKDWDRQTLDNIGDNMPLDRDSDDDDGGGDDSSDDDEDSDNSWFYINNVLMQIKMFFC